MAAVGLGGPPDPRPLPFFDLRPRLGQLVEVWPQLLNFDGVLHLLADLHHPFFVRCPKMTPKWAGNGRHA